jgi:hypothetical protein
MSYIISVPGEPEKLDFQAIHQTAVAYANNAYFEKYNVYKNDDPEWKIGNERHHFWLDAFDLRQTQLILNPS